MDYNTLSYKDLQLLAKEHGVAANKKKAELVELLQAIHPVVHAEEEANKEQESEVVSEDKQDELCAVLESLTISPGSAVETEDLHSMSVADLKVKAKELGIQALKKKADLIVAIQAALNTPAEPVAAAPAASSVPMQENETKVDVCDDAQLQEFIERSDFLSFNERGRVVCSLTGHEMKPRFSTVMQHVSGVNVTQKRKTSTKQVLVHDSEIVTKLAGIPSPQGTRKVFCDTPMKSQPLEDHNVCWTYDEYEQVEQV